MLPILAPILVFGLVVFVHELGHFLAAKAVGVYAPRFSIGFGPALLRKRVGETEYVLAALPLGGYVRMASREDEAMALIEGGDERAPDELPTTGGNAAGRAVDDHAGAPERARGWDPDAMVPFGPRPVPADRWFESKPLPARLMIMLAGVTMNVVLAYVVSVTIFAAYGRSYVADRLPAVVDSVLPNRPAARAGFARGDSIVAIDGAPVREWNDVLTHLTDAPGRALRVTVARSGATRTLDVTPEPTQVTDSATGRTRTVGRVGLGPKFVVEHEDVSFGRALTLGGRATWITLTSVGGTLRGLFTREVALSNLGGPIAIARTSVQAAREGLEPLLYLIAILSANLAIINLLPIPVLDGGQILLNVVESVRGRQLSPRTRGAVLYAGIAAVLLLVLATTFNDVTALFGLRR